MIIVTSDNVSHSENEKWDDSENSSILVEERKSTADWFHFLEKQMRFLFYKTTSILENRFARTHLNSSRKLGEHKKAQRMQDMEVEQYT